MMRQKKWAATLLSSCLLVALPACGVDEDGDGFNAGRDCDDGDVNANPGATEVCDFVDNDCDGEVDEGSDQDQDQFTTCNGDCNDLQAGINPNVNEACTPVGQTGDGIDNDCDGTVDNSCPLPPDGDQDGFGIDVDCNDQNFSINPGAIEVDNNQVDDDCDGLVDFLEDPLLPCDGNLNPNDPFSFAKAIGLCHGEVETISFAGPSNPQARAITGSYGPNAPLEGSSQVLISTGLANTSAHDPGINAPFGFNNTFPNPDTTVSQGCSQTNPPPAPPSDVFDYTEINMTIRVPTNAFGFSYQFQFFSSEYPTYHCSDFNDTFLAELDSNEFTGNISFDANGSVVSVNNGFFQVCSINDQGNICLANPAPQTVLNGTGFELNGGSDPISSVSAGATQTLLTTVPNVAPGELITLRFIVFDEGDGQLDSLVRLDNFVWSAIGCIPAPENNQCQPVTKIP